MEFINDESSQNIIDISNTADWFSFKKEATASNDPFAVDIEELKKFKVTKLDYLCRPLKLLADAYQVPRPYRANL